MSVLLQLVVVTLVEGDPRVTEGGIPGLGVGMQVVRFTRSLTPGVLVETILGVPDKTVDIY